MALTWYKVPGKDGTIGREIDFTLEEPTASWYAAQVGDDFYLLVDEALSYPTLTSEEVEAAGIDPDRSVTGA